jgi:hypothetical protein
MVFRRPGRRDPGTSVLFVQLPTRNITQWQPTPDPFYDVCDSVHDPRPTASRAVPHCLPNAILQTYAGEVSIRRHGMSGSKPGRYSQMIWWWSAPPFLLVAPAHVIG